MTGPGFSTRLGGLLGCSLAAAAALQAGQAQASESGASLYLLGSGGPGAAVTPPYKGLYFDNTGYFYDGGASGSKPFVVGGKVVADLNAQVAADFATLLWVPTNHFLGGVLAVGAALPVGHESVVASAFLTGPLGHQLSGAQSDSAWLVGDPIGTALVGWKSGNLSYQFSTMLNVPIGEYREGQIANLAFHRWAGDVAFATTWHDDASGWDVSGKAGVTFNGTNTATQYTTGTELHLEGAIQKTFGKAIAIGVQAYYFDQLTGDSGAGAKLGPFKGQVVGFGATAAHTFMLGKYPATLRVRGMTEFDARNRLEGNSAWLDLSFPLSMKLPAAPFHD